MFKKPYLVASMMCLGTMGTAQAEQWAGSSNTAVTALARANITNIAQLDQRSSYLDFEKSSGQQKHNFEQVQSADDGDTRVNLAMNFSLQEDDEVNFQLGAVSLEFPEDTDNQLAVDIRPFFYLGIGSRW